MTFTEAAAEVLRLVGRPLHYKDITDIAIEKNMLSHVGKSPEVTMGARLAALLKKGPKENPLVRVKPGVFALRDWDEETIKKGLAATGPIHLPETPAAEAEATEGEGAAKPAIPSVAASRPVLDDDEVEQTPDEKRRAEIAAAGAEVFDEEDDDDEPILGGDESAAPAAGGDAAQGGRRRRRRRRRGGRGATGDAAPGNGGLPSYSATPAYTEAPAGGSNGDAYEPPIARVSVAPEPAAIVEPGVAVDDLAGRDLADAVAFLLNTLDRNGGPVSLRQIAETAQRRGRLSGELAAAQSQIAAAVRADNLRRSANGQRARFRFAGGRLALTDWLLGGEMARLEAEALAAVERYRDASRRSFLRKMSELPGHAFVELVLLALDKAGFAQLRAVRRPGTPPVEAHFSAVQRTGFGEVRTAIVIRKDGREIGRERVIDLRGALHHYGPAVSGWLVTAGQVLSGAREESAAPATAPVALYDGVAIARLCEENEVAVLRTHVPVSVPDVDFLEALRAS